MLEWLKRLVARRELAELEELRREMLMLDFRRSVDRHQDRIKRFAAESGAASHEGVGRCRMRFDRPTDFSRAPVLPRDTDEQCQRGIDYRFLGVTGEEEA